MIGLAVAAVAVAWAGGGTSPPSGDFEVFAVDDGGGGWIAHHLTRRGDALWGCADVSVAARCQQVFFEAWAVGARIQVLHVDAQTQRAWVVLSAGGDADVLYACEAPEASPRCQAVPLELRPPLARLHVAWPPPPTRLACEAPGCPFVPPTSPALRVGPASAGQLWLEAAAPTAGAVNLYACRDLNGSPNCALSVPDWLAVDRGEIGVGRWEDIAVVDDAGVTTWGPGVRATRIDVGSAAAQAGLVDGDVVVSIGGFAVSRADHARAVIGQFPAMQEVSVGLADGRTLRLVIPRRR
ncbi:MAG: hypothetical protein RLZZ383_141 [Pseudomonadota bacterium]